MSRRSPAESRPRVSVPRIIVIVVLVSGLVAWGLSEYLRSSTDGARLPPDPEISIPTQDFADPNTRQELLEIAGTGRSALVQQCRDDTWEAYRLYDEAGFTPRWFKRDVQLQVTGQTARAVSNLQTVDFRTSAATSDPVTRRDEVALSPEDLNRFRRELIKSGIFLSPVQPGAMICQDGGTIIFEACHQGRYFARGGGCGRANKSLERVGALMASVFQSGAEGGENSK